jgi:hypothetical protein
MTPDPEVLVTWALLAATVALAGGVAFLMFLALRALFKWVVGPLRRETPKPMATAASLPHSVSASDLYAVRANLDAVSRQLADLEAKIRLAAAYPPRKAYT